MSSTTTAVTVKDLVTEVRRLAAESPDFRYKDRVGQYADCVYNATDSAPACIMGQALANIGMPVPALYEGMRVNAVLEGMTNWDLDTAEGWWLRQVQLGQDGGDTWAEAVADADRYHPNV